MEQSKVLKRQRKQSAKDLVFQAALQYVSLAGNLNDPDYKKLQKAVQNYNTQFSK